MKIVVTGGGTAGHVTPLLAVAAELHSIDENTHTFYIGMHGHALNDKHLLEANISKQRGIFAGKLRRYHGKSIAWYIKRPSIIIHNIKDIFLFFVGCIESIVILLLWRPNAVFVKGGYVGLPVGLASVLLRIPLIIHDSDAYPGLTNRILSRWASVIGVGMPIENYPKYPAYKVHFCGVPVRSVFLDAPSQDIARQQLHIPDSARYIVAVTGGSLGAVRLNEYILDSIAALLESKELHIVWVTGVHHYKEIHKRVEVYIRDNRITLIQYTDAMVSVLSSASIVVTRAGATTLAELALLQKPSIIVPNPLLTGGHQVKNAEAYANKHAAIVLYEKELNKSPANLSIAIKNTLTNPDVIEKLSHAIASMAEPHAANKIATLILGATNKGG